jgi:3-oxoadipate enol-lactonase
MPYADNAGVRLYWTSQGSGTPLLMIMGLSFTHEMWYRILPFLTEQYRVILFDNRGMGRSDVPPGPYSMRRMAEDAEVVLDAAGVSAAHVIGASMGGMIAQELALRSPDRVLSLVLGCTSYSGLFARWPRFRHAPRPFGWNGLNRRQREDALVPLLYCDKTPRDRIEEDFDIRCRCVWTYKGFLNQFSGILLWNAYRRLPRISAPTMVVHGAQDRLIPPQNGRIVASRIPGAEFHLIQNAGHILMTDQPEISRELVMSFLERVIPAPPDTALNASFG